MSAPQQGHGGVSVYNVGSGTDNSHITIKEYATYFFIMIFVLFFPMNGIFQQIQKQCYVTTIPTSPNDFWSKPWTDGLSLLLASTRSSLLQPERFGRFYFLYAFFLFFYFFFLIFALNLLIHTFCQILIYIGNSFQIVENDKYPRLKRVFTNIKYLDEQVKLAMKSSGKIYPVLLSFGLILLFFPYLILFSLIQFGTMIVCSTSSTLGLNVCT